MLGVVRVVQDVGIYTVLVTRHSTLHNSVQEERDGPLRYGFVPANLSIERGLELFGQRLTLEHQVWIMILPNQQGERVDIEKARGFRRSPLQVVQPNGGSAMVARLPKLRAHAIPNLQRAQLQLDCIDCSFDTRFEERGDFDSAVNS